MNLVDVMAVHDHEWAGKPRKAGELYQADTDDDRFDALLITGLAKKVEVSANPEPRRGRYQRRDMKAEE